MPLVPFTPESLQPGRSDSKNSATTCKGLCASGRPCRRSLPTSPSKSLAGPVEPSFVSVPRGRHGETPISFCWQHKDQASHVQPTPSSNPAPLGQRSSIDTLVDRLGNVRLRDSIIASGVSPQSQEEIRTRDFRSRQRLPRLRDDGHKHSRRKIGFWASLCCVTEKEEDDYLEIVSHRKRTEIPQPVEGMTTNSGTKFVVPQVSQAEELDFQLRLEEAQQDNRTATITTSWIPQTLSSSTREALTKELNKPISPTDISGYIYMFWLTDGHSDVPSPTAIHSVFSSPASPNRPNISTSSSVFDKEVPILLKIGRTSNVHRRMNEWSRQCNYNLILVRFYPYISTSSGVSPGTIKQVPYARRVERLIHIELADKRSKQGKCTICQKEHREWFKIDASRKALKEIDETIRRWVTWAEETKQDTT